MRRALVIVGKAPRPGRTKTRLVPPLSADQAADLSSAFLLDTVELGLGLGWECVSVVHPAEPDEAELLAQLCLPRCACAPRSALAWAAPCAAPSPITSPSSSSAWCWSIATAQRCRRILHGLDPMP